MEFVDAWTVLLSENAPPPKESNARFHPLLHAAKAKLESLPEEAAYALGISGISIDINYLNGIRRSHSRVFSGDIGEDLVFGFSGSQLLSYVERYRGRKVVKNQHEIITIRIRFCKDLPNFISLENVGQFAQGICRGIFLSALIRGKYIKDVGVNRINGILRNLGEGARFGTQISRTLNVLNTYSGSILTYYVSIFDDKAFLEYSHRNIGNRVHKNAMYCGAKNDHFEISDDSLLSLRRGKSVVMPLSLLSDGKSVSLGSILLRRQLYRQAIGLEPNDSREQISIDVFNTFQVVFHPISWDGDLLGGVVQVFESFDPLFFDNSLALGGHLSARYGSISRWVWQMRFEGMIVNPLFKSRDTKTQDDTAFLIMPFGESWSGGVEQSVREILQVEGYTVTRADDMFGPNIMEDIWSGVLKSRYVICDTTGRNPNVYYELGICHAIGKDVILLTQSVGDIPFDVRHLRHIVYENTLDGARKLQKGIQGFIRKDRKS